MCVYKLVKRVVRVLAADFHVRYAKSGKYRLTWNGT